MNHPPVPPVPPEVFTVCPHCLRETSLMDVARDHRGSLYHLCVEHGVVVPRNSVVRNFSPSSFGARPWPVTSLDALSSALDARMGGWEAA